MNNPIYLGGDYTDLVIEVSNWRFKRFKYPLDPTLCGTSVFVESVKSRGNDSGRVSELHSSLPGKKEFIKSELISIPEDKVSAVKGATKKRKPV